MKFYNLPVAIIIIIISFDTSQASTIENELVDIKSRLQKLEQLVNQQNAIMENQSKVIQEKNRQIEELVYHAKVRKNDPEKGSSWFNNIEIGGVAEVEAGYNNPDEGESNSDIVLATAELSVNAKVNDWVSAETTLLFEEDDTDLEVDVASITISDPNRPWFVTTGLLYEPFGTFETNLISDPLTLEIAETRESTLLAGINHNGFSGGLYVFNGDLSEDGDDDIDNFGAFMRYAHESDGGSEFAINLGYINDIGDSDNLQDAIQENLDAAAVEYSDYVGGISIDATYRYGPFNVVAEYIKATDDFEIEELPFKTGGAEPEAFNLEVGYHFNIRGIPMTVALAYQGTDESVALELPEKRIIGGFSAEIFDATSLSFEWAHDDDYNSSDGGTDEFGGNTLTSQLAVEF